MIENEDLSVKYYGDGSKYEFAFAFAIHYESDLSVSVYDINDPYNPTTLTLGENYTVHPTVGGFKNGGYIQMIEYDPDTASYIPYYYNSDIKITIIRNPDRLFLSEYVHNEIVPKDQLQRDFERVYMHLLYFYYKLLRTVRVADEDDAGLQLPPKEVRASHAIVCDSDGDLVAGEQIITPVSGFMEDFLQATTWDELDGLGIFERVLTYDDYHSGFSDSETGFVTDPNDPNISITLTGVQKFGTVEISWNQITILTNASHYELERSLYPSSGFAKIRDIPYPGTVAFDRPPVPKNEAGDPVEETYYYRVRLKTKDDTVTGYSNVLSVVALPVDGAEIEVGSISATKMETTVLNAMIAEIKDSLTIDSSTGFTGTAPDMSRRIYLDEDEMAFQISNDGVWETFAKIGGINTNGVWMPFFQGKGLVQNAVDPWDAGIGDIPTISANVFPFNDDYEDISGVDPWTEKNNNAITTGKYGLGALTALTGEECTMIAVAYFSSITSLSLSFWFKKGDGGKSITWPVIARLRSSGLYEDDYFVMASRISHGDEYRGHITAGVSRIKDTWTLYDSLLNDPPDSDSYGSTVPSQQCYDFEASYIRKDSANGYYLIVHKRTGKLTWDDYILVAEGSVYPPGNSRLSASPDGRFLFFIKPSVSDTVGEVEIYKNDNYSFTHMQTIEGPDGVNYTSFGANAQIYIEEDGKYRLYVSAERHTEGPGPYNHVGAIYVYEYSASEDQWSLEQTITDLTGSNYYFGKTFCKNYDTMYVIGRSGYTGSAYDLVVFERDAMGVWSYSETIDTDIYVSPGLAPQSCTNKYIAVPTSPGVVVYEKDGGSWVSSSLTSTSQSAPLFISEEVLIRSISNDNYQLREKIGVQTWASPDNKPFPGVAQIKSISAEHIVNNDLDVVLFNDLVAVEKEISNDEWYNISLNWDGTNIKGIVGSLEFTEAYSAVSSENFNLELYVENGWLIDDLLVAEVALTIDQAEEHALSGMPWVEPGSPNGKKDLIFRPTDDGRNIFYGDIVVNGSFSMTVNDVFDTGWVTCSDWTFQLLGETVGANIIHNLNTPLAMLDITVLIDYSTWGVQITPQSSDNDADVGWVPIEIDNNTIKIVTGSGGIPVVRGDTGGFAARTTQTAQYRVLVRPKYPRTGATGSKGDTGDTGAPGDSINWLGELADYPASPAERDAFYHTGDGQSYFYNGSSWDKMSQKGNSLNWLGELADYPTTPEELDSFYHTGDEQSYLYDGTEWNQLTKKGDPGTNVPDISGLTEDTEPQDTDYFIEYDVSASAHKKVKKENIGPGSAIKVEAGENLSQGDPLYIRTDTKAYKTEKFQDIATVDSTGTSMAYIKVTVGELSGFENHFVVCNNADPGSNAGGWVRVGHVDTDTGSIVWDTAFTKGFDNGAGVRGCVGHESGSFCLRTSSGFRIGHYDDTAGTVEWDTPVFDPFTHSPWGNYCCDMAPFGTDKYILLLTNNGDYADGDYRIRICHASGGSVVYDIDDTSVTTTLSTDMNYGPGAVDLDGTYFAVGWYGGNVDGYNIRMRIGSISGSSISWEDGSSPPSYGSFPTSYFSSSDTEFASMVYHNLDIYLYANKNIKKFRYNSSTREVTQLTTSEDDETVLTESTLTDKIMKCRIFVNADGEVFLVDVYSNRPIYIHTIEFDPDTERMKVVETFSYDPTAAYDLRTGMGAVLTSSNSIIYQLCSADSTTQYCVVEYGKLGMAIDGLANTDVVSGNNVSIVSDRYITFPPSTFSDVGKPVYVSLNSAYTTVTQEFASGSTPADYVKVGRAISDSILLLKIEE